MSLLLMMVVSGLSPSSAAPASVALKWRMFEVTLHAAKTPGNPFTDVMLTATVTRPDGTTRTLDGFYDGDGRGGQKGTVWKLRFSPDQLGLWKWKTHSNDAGLDGRSGAFNCVASNHHGPLLAEGRYFKYADGGFVYLTGNFLDDRAPHRERYSHTLFSEQLTDADRRHILDRARTVVRARKLNIYLANKGDYGGPATTPWLGTADRNDKTRFALSRWKQYDSLIAKLDELGITAELWFFADDSNFGKLPATTRHRLIQYGLSRLSAYPNTLFVLCLEWQEGWTSDMVAADLTCGRRHNPWRRLWSVHGVTGNFAFPNQPWVDFMATQPGNDISPVPCNTHTRYNREVSEKPLLVEELGHARESTRDRLRGNVWACFCGGAAGCGTGCDLARLREFIDTRRVPFWRMVADNSLASRGFTLLDEGNEYVVYVPTGGEVSVLTAPGTYHAEWFNPRQDETHAVVAIGNVTGGRQTFSTPDGNDWVLHLKRVPGRSHLSTRVSTGLLVQHGWFVHAGKVIWGWVQHNGWWRPGQRPNLCRRSLGDPHGDVRPCRTEDLNKLTDSMVRFGYPGFEHDYGLWYDRRRDRHDTAVRTDSRVVPPFLEQPWARSGTGRAADGLTRYDLAKFNPWYFHRVKTFADLCDRKGTVLLYKCHMQHALLEQQAHYVDFPWRPGNCVQQTALPSKIPAANVFYDMSNPMRRQMQRLYIRKCLDVLGDNRNVVFLPGEEYTGPLGFVRFWIDTIVQWENETGKHVTVGLGAPKDVVDAILDDPIRSSAVEVLDLRCWWIRKDGSLYAPKGGGQTPGRFIENGVGAGKESTPECIYRQVREYRDRYPDKALISAVNGSRRQCLAFFMAGGSLLVRGQIHYPDYADPPEYVKPADVDLILPTYRFVRSRLAGTLPRMRPADVVRAPDNAAWCLAAPGRTYLVYTLHGGKLTLDLSQAAGVFAVQWFNPRTGDLTRSTSVTAAPSVAFQAPDGNDWFLWLNKE